MSSTKSASAAFIQQHDPAVRPITKVLRMPRIHSFSPSRYYRQAPRSPVFGGKRPQFGNHAYEFFQQPSGNSILSLFWKGAVILAAGLLSLNCFKPEWFNKATETAQGAFESVRPWLIKTRARIAARTPKIMDGPYVIGSIAPEVD
jgi:hypothetical protein